MTRSELGAADGLEVALLGLVEVNDVPDGVEVVSLDVQVLEVESVLPDIDADDRDERQERVLVRGSRQLEALVLRVHALHHTLVSVCTSRLTK